MTKIFALILLVTCIYAIDPPPNWVTIGELNNNENEILYVIVTDVKTTEIGLRIATVTIVDCQNQQYCGRNIMLFWNRDPEAYDTSQTRGTTVNSDGKVPVKIGDKYVVCINKSEIVKDQVHFTSYFGQAIYNVSLNEWIIRKDNVDYSKKSSVFLQRIQK